MQVIEVLVFFFFAVMAGFLVIGFIGGFDFQKMYDGLTAILGGRPNDLNTFTTADYYTFLGRVSDCWKACNFGKEDRDCGMVRVLQAEEKDYGKPLSQAALEADFKKFNICETCTVQVTPAGLTIPSNVRVKCDKAAKAVLIQG
jgi:hypothetical protein